MKDLSVHVNYQDSRLCVIINEAPLHDVKALMWCTANGTTMVETINLHRYMTDRGHAVAEWLRHYATNRQVAGSIPYGVIGIFQ